jgi:cytoskeletal protein RodZ
MADLRNAGTESPSGRLVIDLATLRQVQAASMSDNLPAGLLKEQTEETVAAGSPRRPEFARVNVALEKESAPRGWKRLGLAAAAMIVLIAVFGAGLLTFRWWRGEASANANHSANANAVSSASPSPEVSPTPSPSPSPSPSLSPTPIKKPEPKKQEKPSRIKSIVNKVKGIFH